MSILEPTQPRHIPVVPVILGAVALAGIGLALRGPAEKAAEDTAKKVVSTKVGTVPGSGQPIILREYESGNIAAHFPEFPVTIFMLGKPEAISLENQPFAARVRLQCDAMCGYRAIERGTMTSILGLWLSPIGLARIRDMAGLESLAKEIADDSAPGGQPFKIPDTRTRSTGILTHIKDGRGVTVSLGMSFVSFDKGMLVMSFAAADDAGAKLMATRMAQSARFQPLPSKKDPTVRG